MKKRVLAMVLSLCLLVGLLPATAFATEAVATTREATDETTLRSALTNISGNVIVLVKNDIDLKQGIVSTGTGTVVIRGETGTETIKAINGDGNQPFVTAGGGDNSMFYFASEDDKPIDITIQNVTIDGNKDNGIQTRLIRCGNARCNLTLGEGAILQNAKHAKNGGGIIIKANTKLIIDGGTIQDCETTGQGGSIQSTAGTVVMNSGLIQRNIGLYSGGITYESNKGSVYLNGGVITQNVVKTGSPRAHGGGLTLNTGTAYISGDIQIYGNYSEDINGKTNTISNDAVLMMKTDKANFILTGPFTGTISFSKDHDAGQDRTGYTVVEAENGYRITEEDVAHFRIVDIVDKTDSEMLYLDPDANTIRIDKKSTVVLFDNETVAVRPGVPFPTFIRDGYVYTGCVEKDETGNIISSNVTMPEAGKTYYAQWTPLSGVCGDPAVNDGKNVTWSLNQNNADAATPTFTLTVSGTGAMANYPAASGQPWKDCIGLITKIEVEAGVTTVGDFAFMNAENAKTVTLPEGLTKIGQRGFANCHALESPVFPSTLVEIGANPFYACNAFETITLPDSLTTMGEMLFYQCENLKSITIPRSATALPNEFVKGCSKLEAIEIPANITSIGNGAFADTGLKEATIPATVSSLSASLFHQCLSLKKVVFEGSAEVKSATLTGCTSLKTVVFTSNSFNIFEEMNNMLFHKNDMTNCVVVLEGENVSPEQIEKLSKKIETGASVIVLALNGGKMEGDSIWSSTLAAPVKADSTFGGWYTDLTDETTRLADDAAPVAGCVYHAKWVACTHAAKAYIADGAVLTAVCADCGHGFGAATLTAPEGLTYDGTAKAASVTISGNWEGAAPAVTYSRGAALAGAPTDAGEYTAQITAGGVTASLTFTIAKAAYPVSLTADKNAMTGTGAVKLTASTVEGITVTGVTCDDESVTVTANEDGTYSVKLPNTTKTYIFTAVVEGDLSNYEEGSATCTVSVTRRSSSGSNNNTTTTTTTTTNSDGSITVVETRKDGTVTTTEMAGNGVTVKAVEKPGEAVTAVVTIPSGVDAVAVTIPVHATPGTVAMDAKTGKMVKLSVPTEDGLLVKLDGSSSLVLEDRSKTFIDTPGHWGEDSIDFTVAHGMFSGTSETTFSPDNFMTRAMMMTVLARFDGADITGGATWYEKGMAWAVANNVSDGTNPEGNITREQLATMLYNYAGSPVVSGNLDRFSDAGSVSEYAVDAMCWAVENGLITGMGDGTLNPQGRATRAQVATMLRWYCVSLIE